MWLTAPGGKPLIMVYFHGPENWHKTRWEFSSQWSKRGWAQLTSRQVNLRIWLDADTGQAQVQSQRVNIRDANTYLTLHVVDAKRQQVVPLGILDLPMSTDSPPSVLLLRRHPELVEKMKEAIAHAGGG